MMAMSKLFGKDFLYMLAPMEDITNYSFRALCCNHGADMAFTEMARIDSLERRNSSTLARLSIKYNTPTIIQLIGNKEKGVEEFLSYFKPEQGFLGFNINAGCPSSEFVNSGMGCAMIKRISKIRKMVDVIKKHGCSASIKIRLGMNDFEKKQKVYLNLIKETDCDFFVVHARHGNQSYNEKADWSVYPECCDTGKKIIANGDIKTKEDVELLRSYGVSGVMIGRAAVVNPAIFNLMKGIEDVPAERLIEEYSELSKGEINPRYRKNFMKFFGKDNFAGENERIN
jgi:tRNA-dihydrouridine synthase B